LTGAAGSQGTPGIEGGGLFTFSSLGFNYFVSGLAGSFPTLTLVRGQLYYFNWNAVASSHPIALRLSNGNTAAVPGTTNNNPTTGQNSTNTLTLYRVPLDAPSSIVYQCVFHSSMIGTINIVNQNGDTGATGPQGPIGLTGAAGATGPQGAAGTNGTNGQNALVKTTAEAAGATCSAGGVKLEYGLDANNNGDLDAIEINSSLTKFVCNGEAANQLNGGSSFSNVLVYSAAGSFSWTVPTGVTKVLVECWGGGASGTYYTGSYAGSAGGYGKGIYTVTSGQIINITVGAGGVPTSNMHNAGGSSSFGIFITSTGGGAAGAGSSEPGNSNGNIISLKGGKDFFIPSTSNRYIKGGDAPYGGFGGVGDSQSNAPGNSPGGGGANFYVNSSNYLNGPGGTGRVIIYY
jgi:hypothetical protein